MTKRVHGKRKLGETIPKDMVFMLRNFLWKELMYIIESLKVLRDGSSLKPNMCWKQFTGTVLQVMYDAVW